MTDLWRLTAGQLAQHFAAGTASPTEALDSVLARIDAVDGHIGAFACVLEEQARARAAELTEELAQGHRRGPLHGVPVAVKELFDVQGAPGDYGSDVLAGRTADADAECVRRLRRAGAVIVGTTRSHEFGWGITTQHQSRGGTRNPWDLNRVPGGSSGGSGAAVAAGMVPAAVGSDTGGSIRIPACFCGVAGLKPAFGRIGRTGGVALAPSFDTVGALGRSIGDAALLVETMSGPDRNDPDCTGTGYGTADRRRPSLPGAATVAASGDEREAQPLLTSLTGVRVATATGLIDIGLDAGIAAVYGQALDSLERLGAELVEIDLPAAEEIFEAFRPLQMAEAHHVHRSMGLFPDQADLYGPDVRSRLEAAADVSIKDYLTAQRERRRIASSFDHRLQSVDALISPISAVGPSRIDSPDEAVLNGQRTPLRDTVMRFTVPQNMTGLLAGIVRAGFDPDGLPVGVQLTASRGQEGAVVAIATALQAELGPIGTAPEPEQAAGG